MAQAGFTPIQCYHSTTPGATPDAANLLVGELAINTADRKLFTKNGSGAVIELIGALSGATVPVANGGTGATTVVQALANLQALSAADAVVGGGPFAISRADSRGNLGVAGAIPQAWSNSYKAVEVASASFVGSTNAPSICAMGGNVYYDLTTNQHKAKVAGTGASLQTMGFTGVYWYACNTPVTQGQTIPFTQIGYINDRGDMRIVGTFSQGSDQRLKKDIRPLDSAIDKVRAMVAVSYVMKEGDGSTELGFVAQQLRPIAPELVSEDPESRMLGVKYDRVTALLVKAFQEQDARLAQMEARLTALELK